MEPSREENVKRIMRTRLFSDGARFTAKDIVGRLNGRKKGAPTVTELMVNRLLCTMKDRGLVIDHRQNSATGGRSTKWSKSKGASNWLAIPWRKHTDYQLGIRP